MALDFIIENNKTFNKEYLPVGTETHWVIYTLAKENGLPLLAKISDYYADYEFSVEDLPRLVLEVDNLIDLITDENQSNFLKELKTLVISAQDQKEKVILRAD